MSMPGSPPDRATLFASLRDYVEQIREEGLDGLEDRKDRGGSAVPNEAGAGAPISASVSNAAITQKVAPPPAATAAPSADAQVGLASAGNSYAYLGLEK